MPDLSVVIVSYNTRDLLPCCLTELREAVAGIEHELIIVDNASTDSSREYLRHEAGDIRLILNERNLGFAAANNQGLRIAEAPIILLLNSDAYISAETVRSAMRTIHCNPHIGLVGVRILNPDGTVQAESGTFPTLWNDIRVSVGLDQLGRSSGQVPTVAWPVDWVHGACMFARRVAVQAVGELDERYFMYSEEVDWCHRFWNSGWQVWYLPEITAVHLGGASSQSNDLSRRMALYQSRLGLRRRLAGPHSSVLLWFAMIVGLVGRLAMRPVLQFITRRKVGYQSADADWQLLLAIVRMDPLSRKLAS